MKRKLCGLLCVIFLFALILSGCSKYRQANFIGKTADQIQEQYGAFDLNGTAFVATDSTYQGFGCGYLLKESRVGFLGTHPAEYFFIEFDENGVATACYEGYHCNGG